MFSKTDSLYATSFMRSFLDTFLAMSWTMYLRSTTLSWSCELPINSQLELQIAFAIGNPSCSATYDY